MRFVCGFLPFLLWGCNNPQRVDNEIMQRAMVMKRASDAKDEDSTDLEKGIPDIDKFVAAHKIDEGNDNIRKFKADAELIKEKVLKLSASITPSKKVVNTKLLELLDCYKNDEFPLWTLTFEYVDSRIKRAERRIFIIWYLNEVVNKRVNQNIVGPSEEDLIRIKKTYDYDRKLCEPLEKILAQYNRMAPVTPISTKEFEAELAEYRSEKKAYEKFNEIVASKPSKEEYMRKLDEVRKETIR